MGGGAYCWYGVVGGNSRREQRRQKTNVKLLRAGVSGIRVDQSATVVYQDTFFSCLAHHVGISPEHEGRLLRDPNGINASCHAVLCYYCLHIRYPDNTSPIRRKHPPAMKGSSFHGTGRTTKKRKERQRRRKALPTYAHPTHVSIYNKALPKRLKAHHAVNM